MITIAYDDDVEVGENFKYGDYIKLKAGTRIGDNVKFGDYVRTTGLCIVGDNVNVRTGATISKGVIIEDWAFIGPGVMTNHTRNVVHGRNLPRIQYMTRIGYAAIVGSMVQINAGCHIPPNTIVGSGAVVTKPLVERGVYVGNPARRVKDTPPEMIAELLNYEEYRFPDDMVARYMPLLAQ